MKLSILDQSPVRKGGSASEALRQTIAVAQLADRRGFTRFWVSEHHNSTAIAGSAPEVLMVKLADETQRIRVGSGGVMLPNHSALKVAENFRLLEALFPGRIDLGMGRAPGGDRISSALLNPSNDFSEQSYRHQLDYLQTFFTDTAGTQYGPILAVPQADTIPLQWILSSSGGSSQLAAEYGMGLAVAKFINGQVSPRIVEDYRRAFEPSESLEKPEALLALFVICADREEKARQLRKVLDYRLVQMDKGKFDGIDDYESIKDYEFTMAEEERLRFHADRVVSGTPDFVKEQLTALANEYGVDEIMASMMAYHFEDRIRSFELLADGFELK
jgi:luciferase family oxidoreductase group 1